MLRRHDRERLILPQELTFEVFLGEKVCEVFLVRRIESDYSEIVAVVADVFNGPQRVCLAEVYLHIVRCVRCGNKLGQRLRDISRTRHGYAHFALFRLVRRGYRLHVVYLHEYLLRAGKEFHSLIGRDNSLRCSAEYRDTKRIFEFFYSLAQIRLCHVKILGSLSYRACFLYLYGIFEVQSIHSAPFCLGLLPFIFSPRRLF